MTKVLLWQNYVCHDKTFVTTNICCNKHVCHNKGFVLTSILLLQQKMCFVMTNICLSWQKYFGTKLFVMTNICHDKSFVAKKKLVTTNIFFSWQNFCHDKRHVLLQQTPVCRDKTFDMTKLLILQVAAPTSDAPIPPKIMPTNKDVSSKINIKSGTVSNACES